ncbi:MAG: hypothetical protein LBB81_10900 [Treponema sp.]|jgi:uncharacterized UBP type Zn finger protein|nr:hypothetical protein [Treponema sp.]
MDENLEILKNRALKTETSVNNPPGTGTVLQGIRRVANNVSAAKCAKCKRDVNLDEYIVCLHCGNGTFM